jgi:hypothetical protein
MWQHIRKTKHSFVPSQEQDSVNIHNDGAICARVPRHIGSLKYSYRQLHYMPKGKKLPRKWRGLRQSNVLNNKACGSTKEIIDRIIYSIVIQYNMI